MPGIDAQVARGRRQTRVSRAGGPQSTWAARLPASPDPSAIAMASTQPKPGVTPEGGDAARDDQVRWCGSSPGGPRTGAAAPRRRGRRPGRAPASTRALGPLSEPAGMAPASIHHAPPPGNPYRGPARPDSAPRGEHDRDAARHRVRRRLEHDRVGVAGAGRGDHDARARRCRSRHADEPVVRGHRRRDQVAPARRHAPGMPGSVAPTRLGAAGAAPRRRAHPAQRARLGARNVS